MGAIVIELSMLEYTHLILAQKRYHSILFKDNLQIILSVLFLKSVIGCCSLFVGMHPCLLFIDSDYVKLFKLFMCVNTYNSSIPISNVIG